MSQNWIEIFFQNYVESMKVICGHHVPLLSMDACTSCQAKQNMSVGDDLVGYDERKYIGTVVGIDGYVYGIPRDTTKRNIKYNPINGITLLDRNLITISTSVFLRSQEMTIKIS